MIIMYVLMDAENWLLIGSEMGSIAASLHL